MTKGTFGQLTCEWQYTYDEFTKEPFIVDGRRLRIEAKVCNHVLFSFWVKLNVEFLVSHLVEKLGEGSWNLAQGNSSDFWLVWAEWWLSACRWNFLGIFCWYASVCGVSVAWKMVIQQNSLRRLQSIFITYSVEIGRNVDLDLVAIPEIQVYRSNTFSSAVLLGFFPFASNQILQKYYKELISS